MLGFSPQDGERHLRVREGGKAAAGTRFRGAGPLQEPPARSAREASRLDDPPAPGALNRPVTWDSVPTLPGPLGSGGRWGGTGARAWLGERAEFCQAGGTHTVSPTARTGVPWEGCRLSAPVRLRPACLPPSARLC